MAELLKTGDVTINGKVIGKIDFDGVFIGLNFKTRKRVQAATLEEVMAWFNTRS